MDFSREFDAPKHSERLGKISVLPIWACIVVIVMLIEEIGRVLDKPSANITLFFSSITLLHIFISSPWVVSFIYIFIGGKKEKLAIKDGALRGAFAALIISATVTIMLFPLDIVESIRLNLQLNSGNLSQATQNVFSISSLADSFWSWAFMFLPFLIPSVVQGAVAGSIAALWKNKDQEKKDVLEEETKMFKSKKNKNRLNNVLFFVAYIFIILGAAITAELMIYYGYWSTLIDPFFFLILVGPSIEALIISIILGKLYNTYLSGLATLLASLIFFFGSAWIMLSILPLPTHSYGLVPLFSMLFVSGGHILCLVVVLVLGWAINFLKRRNSMIR